MNAAVLDHKADQYDLVLEAGHAEKMNDGSYHLIAPNGRLLGTLGKYEGEYEFHSTVESDGDRLHLQIPEQVAEDFIKEVEIREPE